jgi:hypothetical protein
VIESVRALDAGLLIPVPNGWLFHVMADCVHAEVTANRSSVRQVAAGIAVTHRRKVAPVTIAELGMLGAQVVRSKETYDRRLRLLRDWLFMVAALPLVVVGAFSSTEESCSDALAPVVPLSVHVIYTVRFFDDTGSDDA